MLVSNLSFSQGTATSINPNDSFYVSVLYKNVVKANQAFTEVKHKRVQIDTLESIISRKNITIKKMSDAHALSHSLNTDYLTIFKAQQKTIRECEELQSKYDFEVKQLKTKNAFIQIGTPVICIAVGSGCLVAGYYIGKALR